MPPLFGREQGAADWPERAETHPFPAEEEPELGFMDDTQHEESSEELFTPEFTNAERDTLWMVEVLTCLISCYLSLCSYLRDSLARQRCFECQTNRLLV